MKPAQFHLAIYAFVLLALPAVAQTPKAVTWEWLVDDQGPPVGTSGAIDALADPDGSPSGWGREGWAVEIPHDNALAVKVADFNHDGVPEIVIGGNSAADDVKVHYFNPFSPHWGWSIIHTEELGPDGQFTRACYDLDAADVNGDGFDDIIVGRRLGPSCEESGIGSCGDPACDDFYARTDTVFLNLGQYAIDNSLTDFFSDPVGSNPPLPLPIPPHLTPGQCENKGWRETFAVRASDYSGDGICDIVTSGSYGLRYFVGAGDGSFTLQQQYFEDQDPTVNPIYRHIAVGNVDGDSDLDLVIPRGDEDVTQVFFFDNRAFAPGTDPGNTVSKPASYVTEWTLMGGAECSDAFTNTLPNESFEGALGDLDGDNDLDLVIANSFAPNAYYYNNGLGQFGDANGATNGLPVDLVSPTPDFYGPTVAPSTPTCVWWVDFPGGALDKTTGVTLFDEDDDGVTDLIAFSNRAEFEELYTIQSPIPPPNCVYLTADPLAYPVPASYDHVYHNVFADDGSRVISPYVELMGEPNDGTTYGEFINLNTDPITSKQADYSPDWIDANFSNEHQCDRNFIYWGQVLRARDVPHFRDFRLNEEMVEYEMLISLTSAPFGTEQELDYEVYVSNSGSYPGNWEVSGGGESLPLFKLGIDALDYWCKNPPGALVCPPSAPIATGFSGEVPKAPRIDFEIDIGIPRCLFDSLEGVNPFYVDNSVWFAVVLRDDSGSVVWMSNALHMPASVPAYPTSPPNPTVEGCAVCQ